jgi:hypothetical protein
MVSDTQLAARDVLVAALRRQTIARKAQTLARAFRDARRLHAAGLRLRLPGADERTVLLDWLTHVTSANLPSDMTPVADTSNLDVLHAVLAVLRRLHIAHALGGSMASSLHGVPRFTLDADIAAEPFPDRIAALTASFPPPYYLSRQAVEDAHRDASSFNIIHTESGFKVDVFICPDEPFARSAMARRQHVALAEQTPPVDIQSPEDVILYKLQWFRIGGVTSSQQWTDVLGVMRVQGERLDQSYLDAWAAPLGVADLLARARAEANPGSLP